MNARDRERLKQLNENGNGNGKHSQKGRSQTNAEAGAGNIKEKLDAARKKMCDSTKAYVLGGVSDALEDIANGDFGEIGEEVFSAFDNLMGEVETGYRQLKKAEIDPKYSLPSASFPAERTQTIEVEVASAN